MIRRVAFLKALFAGAAGALAWDLVARVLIWSGIPAFDLVQQLGTMLLPGASVFVWWPLGLSLHVTVGAIWAIVYAYFFWAEHDWRPRTQGVVFSLGPAVLAGLIMVPQMGWMRLDVLRGATPPPGLVAWNFGWGGPLAIVLGHLIYGATMGTLYTHPVGHSTKSRARIANLATTGRHRRSASRENGVERGGEFMFATGIECSYPTIENGRWRMDQLFETGHYRYWRRDLELVRQLGLRYLRYGPPLHHVWTGPDKYDWSFMDTVTDAMRELHIVPIMDLCHFGVPHWLGTFQDPDFPELFARYATAFARRYPWVRLYTPVNEMYVTAKMSALDGVWNEQLRSERGFVTASAFAAVTLFGGAAYGRVFMRAANDRRGGWLFGIGFGFLVWMLGPSTMLYWLWHAPLVTGRASQALFASHLLLGSFLALRFPTFTLLLSGDWHAQDSDSNQTRVRRAFSPRRIKNPRGTALASRTD